MFTGIHTKHFTLTSLFYGLLITGYWLLVTGCSPAKPTVSFAVFGDPAAFAAYEALVAAFGEAHPEIDVRLEHTPSQSAYRQKLATTFSAGTPPDVMLLNYRRFATFAETGGLEPLGARIAASDQFSVDDFFEIAIDSFEWNEQLWCVPQNLSSLVVYLNLDLFAEAGVALPPNDWTWDDFLQVAQQLTHDHDQDGVIDQYGVGLSPRLFRVAPFVWQNGGEIVDNQANPTRLTLDDPVSLVALRWFVALQMEHQIVPDAVAESAEPSETRFLNGTLAMQFNSRRGVPTYRTITDFEWDVHPLPRGEETAGILHSDAYCLSASAENKDAAWTFIEFANSVAGQTIVAASGRTVPSLKAVAESEAFLDPNLPPANARVFIDTADTLRRVPIMAGWVGVEEAANKEIERAFYGQATLEEVLGAMEMITAPYFGR